MILVDQEHLTAPQKQINPMSPASQSWGEFDIHHTENKNKCIWRYTKRSFKSVSVGSFFSRNVCLVCVWLDEHIVTCDVQSFRNIINNASSSDVHIMDNHIYEMYNIFIFYIYEVKV